MKASLMKMYKPYFGSYYETFQLIYDYLILCPKSLAVRG